MQQEVEALLALQSDDAGIRELEKQLDALDPELADLDRRREQAAGAVARAQSAAEAEEKRQREIQRGSPSTRLNRSGISPSSTK